MPSSDPKWNRYEEDGHIFNRIEDHLWKCEKCGATKDDINWIGLPTESAASLIINGDDKWGLFKTCDEALALLKEREDINNHTACPTHCCAIHRCKYSFDDCPVMLGLVKQKYRCEECQYEEKETAYLRTTTHRFFDADMILHEVKVVSIEDKTIER